ncbi:hypothetical protein Tco_0158675 [Tanacetum coccineum]
MVALISCPKHNMVACLEKTERNAQFHEIVDFLTRSSIYYSLTVSPTVSTSLIEQFWNTATSKIVNDVSYIKAKVAGKTVSISEASIRRDLLFNDVDGIDCLTNQEIYENLQLMGYEGDLTILTFQKALFSPPWKNLDAKKQFLMYPRFVQVFINNQLSNLPTPLDNLPIPVLTKKVFTNMAKQGLHFSGHDTPLFPNMLAQAIVDEGVGGHTSDRAEGGLNLDKLLVLCTNLSNRVLALETSKDAQATEILKLKTKIKKLEKKKEGVCIQIEEKNAKPSPTLDAFDDLDANLAHGMDYMEIEEPGSGEKGVSTISTARPDVDTARPEVNTASAPISTAGVTISTVDPEVSAVEPRTPPTTTSIFDDKDITMAQTLIKMTEEKAKEKGVAFKDVEDSSRPVRSITTLKPLLSIDPKDKGKGILVEEEPVKIKRKDQWIDHIERDEELAHKLHEEELTEIARIQEEKAA